MSTIHEGPAEHLLEWLTEEYEYGRAKFGPNQSGQLRATSLSNNQNFGGQTSRYWERMRTFELGGAQLQRAQAAAKVASSARSLWATIRSIDRPDDRSATADSLIIIENHFGESDFHEAKRQVHKDDFWETSMGLGLTYLEDHVRRNGFARKFRLGQLVRAEQIMLDASDVAALQFEAVLASVDELPKPGVPSGEIEPWFAG
jgi:outer membrane receptor protein involved in Fe transport